jgi:glycosyltransferase involved in cell wall biosynthesis
MKKISVITGVYNEALTVQEVYQTIRDVFENRLQGRYDYEHIFMDNCSSDNTLEILKGIAAHDKRVKIVSYSRNFGPIKTELVGYQHATGDAVVPYEANLKDPPELILEFIKKWEEGYLVAYGVRTQTKDNFVLRSCRKLFYRIISGFSGDKLPLNAGSFRLVDRKVVDELVKIDDFKPYTRGYMTLIGFRQLGIEYTRRSRPRGYSKSRINYLIDFAINALISHSHLPIRLCTYLGLFLSGMSFLGAFVYFLLKLFVWPAQLPGLAAVIFLVLFFSGIQIFFLGIIGEYVGAIHSQVRRKPFVVIREKVNFG